MIMSPKMVSAGFTPLTRLVYPYNDPFVVALNRYVNYENMRYTYPTKVAYYPQELQDRINMALNSVPIGAQRTAYGGVGAQTPATTPMV